MGKEQVTFDNVMGVILMPMGALLLMVTYHISSVAWTFIVTGLAILWISFYRILKERGNGYRS